MSNEQNPLTLKLLLPLRDIAINQPFGVNYLDFYKQLGMKGHNGIDFRAMHNPPVMAAHSGVVVTAGMDGGGGICVEIITNRVGDGYKTIYYHLQKTAVNVGKEVQAGDIIGYADNTGKYTTGDHLHFGLKAIKNGETVNKNNGFNGAIDPAPYFKANDVDWDKSNAYKRYGRKRTWQTFTLNEIPVSISLTKFLKRKPSFEQINACVYGGWDREIVRDDAMYGVWGWLKKDENKNGKLAF